MTLLHVFTEMLLRFRSSKGFSPCDQLALAYQHVFVIVFMLQKIYIKMNNNSFLDINTIIYNANLTVVFRNFG